MNENQKTEGNGQETDEQINDSTAQSETENTAQSENENNAQSETENTAKNGGLGKFCDADSLLSAYNALQAKFTQKCQELSKLKSGGDLPQQLDEEFIQQKILTNKDITDRVIGQYLRQLSGGRAPVTISGSYGLAPYMPPKKPKTLAEAAVMAQKLMENI
ncbi:MAG: hypothetical protein PHE12_01670 [Clostridia bacterium]|nr:hypothetical protein [Clostridia bacterium]